MFTALLQKIKNRLKTYKAFDRVFYVLNRTPTYAVHWYLVMFIGLITTIVGVGTGVVVFKSATTNLNVNSRGGVSAVTINKDSLEEALGAYRTKDIELDRLLKNTPSIIDPGR